MKEIRNNDIAYSIDLEKRTVEGYCIVFNSKSKLLNNSFYEVINPNSITEETLRSSDIYFLLNHDVNRGLLARSNKGEGSLHLEIHEDKGVYFRFEAPNTALGTEILEGIRRKDINGCSFAFTVAEDEFTKENDGTILRTINRFERLFDCSVVYNPAYDSTEVDLRSYEAFLSHSNEENNADNTNLQMEEEKRNEGELEALNEVVEVVEDNEERSDDSDKEKEQEETTETKEETTEDSEEEKEKDSDETDEEKEDKRNINNNSDTELRNNPNININHSTMKKEFNLLRNINNIVNGKELDEVAQSLTVEGRSQSNKVGVSSNGQIVIPFEIENRFEDTPNGIIASTEPSATVAGMGSEVVPTVKTDLLGSIKQKMVLSDLGCRWFNLTSNVEIPLYDGNQAYWESELGEAQDGSGKFRLVKLAPKRISTVMYISKQWAMQTSPSANAVLMDEITYSIAHKLQETLLGDGASDDVTPAGIFYNVATDADEVDYESVVAMEELLEARGYSDYKYLASPSAKAVLRTTVKGENANAGFIMQNNEIEGRTVLSTGDVTPKGLICGDFSQMAIASFGGLDITVNPYSFARTNQIEIVVTGYFDVATLRDNAFVKRILK